MDLVGITERYRQYVKNLNYMLGEQPPERMIRVNQTTRRGPPPNDTGLKRDFQEFHANDYELYTQAVQVDREISAEIRIQIQGEMNPELHNRRSFSLL